MTSAHSLLSRAALAAAIVTLCAACSSRAPEATPAIALDESGCPPASSISADASGGLTVMEVVRVGDEWWLRHHGQPAEGPSPKLGDRFVIVDDDGRLGSGTITQTGPSPVACYDGPCPHDHVFDFTAPLTRRATGLIHAIGPTNERLPAARRLVPGRSSMNDGELDSVSTCPLTEDWTASFAFDLDGDAQPDLELRQRFCSGCGQSQNTAPGNEARWSWSSETSSASPGPGRTKSVRSPRDEPAPAAAA
ncbi:MAG: hypothetical protein R3B70_11970 [Polyangiaceae bacterium]